MSNLLSYGMIIKIIAPDNDLLHNKDFFIYFINTEKIVLLNETDNETLRIVDKKIQDETIKEIQILNKPSEQGYVKQNNLNIKTWVDIYFNGTIPVVITGHITNIEEDMIELKTYPDEDIIYIDFKYQGLPQELNIEKIVIRSSPKEEENPEINEDIEPLEDETEKSEDNEPLEIEDTFTEKGDDVLDLKELNDNIVDADKIELLEDLDDIEYIVDVEDDKLRYSIKEQMGDLLDSLLEKIPTSERSSEKLKQINLLINRFKQLREKTSIFDDNLNVIEMKKQPENNKPLIDTIINSDTAIKYLIKIVQNKKKIYDYDDIPRDIDDVVKVKLCDERMSEFAIMQKYKTNFFSDKDNPMNHAIKLLSDYYKPFENKINKNLEVNSNCDEDVIINNDENYCNMAFNTDSLNKVCFNQQRYIKGDILDLKSILFMPYPFIKYNNINVPNISILDKANINTIELFVYKILQNININTTIIDEYSDIVTDKNHLNMVNEFSFTPGKEFNYSQMLQKIIPSNTELIEIMKEHLTQSYNLHNALMVLSGFHIDIDNLNDSENMLIQEIIKTNIEKLLLENQRLSKYARQIKHKKKKKQSDFFTVSVSTSLKEGLYSIYKIDPEVKLLTDYSNTLSNSELLYRMSFDNWSLLNHSIIESNMDLFNPFTSDKIQEIYEKASSKKEFVPDNNCKETILAKKYNTIDELENDRDKTIYFDKLYDPTFYDIKEDYATEQENMDYGDFKKFLTDQLIKNIGLNKEAAEQEAQTMIMGKKEVQDGHYAILELNNSVDKTVYYYTRNKKKWIRDQTITEGVMIDKNKLLCNIKANCFQEKDNCEYMDAISDVNSSAENINKVINEYSDIGNLDKEKLGKEITKKLKNSLQSINYILEKKNREELKKNRMQIALGNINEEEGIMSPYEKIRDKIMGEMDFVKKQQFIQKFVTNYTREAKFEENENWLYCIDTDIKLIPLFLKKLSEAFLVTHNYLDVVNRLCRDIGTLSDDGDSWVDKHSGYVIKKIDLVNETNYTESGFKDVYTDVIEQDAGAIILDTKTDKIDETPESRYIKNIVNTITENMGISIDPVFTVKHTNLLLKKEIPTETKYNYKIKQILKGKPDKILDTYENYYNSSLLYLTLGFLLIEIQSTIPSVKTKKTFPNCKRSFLGYPLYDDKDLGALEYLSCIAFKIKNSTIQPWSSISKLKETTILKKIKMHLDNYILKNQFVQEKISIKRKHLSENTEDDNSGYFTTNWQTFLPPIYKYSFKSIENISESFKESLRADIVKGNKDQFTKINTLRGKIIAYSTAIHAMINEIIKRKTPLLSNVYQEPFLENACCNDKNTSPFEYFSEINNLIHVYNNNIKNLENILFDIETNFSKPQMILFFKDTRTPSIDMIEQFDENTIYKCIIQFANFTNDDPIPDHISKFLHLKPDMEEVKDEPIFEQIVHLKNTGYTYEADLFKKVLQEEHQLNMTEIKSKTIIDNNKTLKAIIDFFSEETQDHIIDLKFIHFFKLSFSGDFKNLNDYLYEKNTYYTKYVNDFIKKYTKLSVIEFSHIEHFVKNFFIFNELGNVNDTINKSITFSKTIVDNIINVYNNILKNKNDYTDITIPNHWNLSNKHNEDIKTIIKNNYESLVTVYGSKNIEMFLIEIERYTNFSNLVLNSPKLNTLHNKIPQDTLELLYQYYVLHLLYTISTINLDTLIVPESEAEIKEVTFGNKKLLKELLSKLLTSEIQTLINYKKTINYNYSTIMEQVLRSKEKEKDVITTRLADMDQDQRNVNNELKQNKLNEWNKGLQKGLTEYVADDYENDEPLEQETYDFGDKFFMADSEMFLNVEMAKADNNNVYNLDLPSEAYDLTTIPDDDDYGERDGDE
jgi:hypothetical protein